MGNQDTNKGLVKAASLMSVFTALSRFLGLAREIVRAHFLGTSLIADAFTMAFMIPNLFRRLVGEGAMTAAAVPVFLDELKAGGTRRLSEVASSFITLFTFVLTIACLLFILAAGFLVQEVFARGYASDPVKIALTVELTRYMFFYLAFIGLAAVLQAILNSFKVFGPSSFTPVLLNIIIILCAILLGDFFSSPVYAFALGVMIGGAAQLFFQVPYLRKVGVRLRPAFNWMDPAVRKILRLMLPGVLGAGVYQVNVLVSQMIATYLAEGSVSALQYSSRLEEFTLGIFVVAIGTAVLPTFATFVRDGRMDELRQMLNFALRLVAFITIPASVGLALIRYPVINLLFRTGEFDQNSVDMTAFAFLFHSMGLFFIGASRILVPVFYSMKDMVTPVKVAVLVMVVNLVLCLVLAGPLSHGGIALANSVSALVQTIALLAYLLGVIGALRWGLLGASILKTLLASTIMGLAVWWAVDVLQLEETTSRVVLLPSLLGVVLLGAGSYALSAWLLRSPEMRDAWRIVTRRFRRR